MRTSSDLQKNWSNPSRNACDSKQRPTSRRPEATPEVEPNTEVEETPNPYNIPSEWVWHDGRFIPLEDVPVEEEEPVAPASSVYLAWDYHSVPNLHDFGSWADESPLHRDLGHAEFGVNMRDGEYIPWMRGDLPETSLYANDEVRRTYDQYGYWTAEYSDLRWEGVLVGFTPEGKSVAGKAALSDFDFGGYEHRGIGPEQEYGWDPGKAYLSFTELSYDDDVTWGDGNLEYEVGIGRTFGGGSTAHDNSFSHPFRRFDCTRQVAGCDNSSLSIAAGVRPEGYSTADDGEVRGMFFGPNHEAIAGTLEREDLTAAFGGTR